MKTFLISLLVFLVFPTVGQSPVTDIAETNKEAIHQNDIDVNIPDSITISNNSEEGFLEKNMPWIIALLIGLLSALVNFWVAHRLRQSNERNLSKQIKSHKNSITKQIETQKDIALTEFKATIATKNRQEWINELRLTLSEYLSSSSLIQPVSKNTNQKMLDERGILIQRMSLSKARLELLMNADKPEQKELLDKIEDLLQIIINKPENYTDKKVKARSEIIYSARKLFGIHWNKIKNLN